MAENTETAILAGGCFWGVQELLRARDGIIATRVGYTGGSNEQPDLPQPPGPRGGGRDRLRPRADLLPRHPGVLLPDPRPVDQGPPGQRHRVELPVRDLLPQRRAAPGRAGHDRRRRRLRPVAGQGRDRGQRGRAVLGGRARAPGLPPAHPGRLHLPLPAPRLEAAAPRGRRLLSRAHARGAVRGVRGPAAGRRRRRPAAAAPRRRRRGSRRRGCAAATGTGGSGTTRTSRRCRTSRGTSWPGRSSAVGADVRRWRAGDRVTVPFANACGTCPTCAQGNHQICDDQRQPGFTHWGAFAELVALDWADVNLVALPDGLDAAAAASLGCRFATAWRAVLQVGRVQAGEWVAVHGCGGVGLSAIMIAVAAGARVVAVDVAPRRPGAGARGRRRGGGRGRDRRPRRHRRRRAPQPRRDRPPGRGRRLGRAACASAAATSRSA